MLFYLREEERRREKREREKGERRLRKECTKGFQDVGGVEREI